MEKQINSITVIGRRWFDRINGNTYHSVSILINGKNAHHEPFRYGYGDSYIDTARKWLKDNGHIDAEDYPNGGRESLWRYCERKGITYSANVADVSRKKDL